MRRSSLPLPDALTELFQSPCVRRFAGGVGWVPVADFPRTLLEARTLAGAWRTAVSWSRQPGPGRRSPTRTRRTASRPCPGGPAGAQLRATSDGGAHGRLLTQLSAHTWVQAMTFVSRSVGGMSVQRDFAREELWRSRDGGRTWTQAPLTVPGGKRLPPWVTGSGWTLSTRATGGFWPPAACSSRAMAARSGGDCPEGLAASRSGALAARFRAPGPKPAPTSRRGGRGDGTREDGR